MKNLQKLKINLKKLGGSIIISSTVGYDSYFEEFIPGYKRLNISFDIETLSVSKILKIKKIVQDVYADYNVILSVKRAGCTGFWIGVPDKKNLILDITPFSERMKSSKEYGILMAGYFFNKEVISGENFVKKILTTNYKWYHILIQMWVRNQIYHLYLSNSLCDEFKFGLLKESFLEFVVGLMLAKGRIGKNKESIKKFAKEKFNDKEMIKIIENIYSNKYSSLDKMTEDILYCFDKFFNWKGISF